MGRSSTETEKKSKKANVKTTHAPSITTNENIKIDRKQASQSIVIAASLFTFLFIGCTLDLEINDFSPPPLPAINVESISLSLSHLPPTQVAWPQMREDSHLEIKVTHAATGQLIKDWNPAEETSFASHYFDSALTAGDNYGISFRARSSKGISS